MSGKGFEMLTHPRDTFIQLILNFFPLTTQIPDLSFMPGYPPINFTLRVDHGARPVRPIQQTQSIIGVTQSLQQADQGS